MSWKEPHIEMPEHKHVKLRTQFSVKGYFKVGLVKGDIHYDVTRLCSYFEEGVVVFESKANFIILGWVEITAWSSDDKSIIDYIENDAEIAMPIDDLFHESGRHLTKKEYGLVLIKHLVIELRKKFKH